MAIDNPHCPDDGVPCAPSGDGICVACGRMFGGQVAQDSELPGMWSASDLIGGEADTQDQVARDEAMCRYVEDYRAEFGDDAVLFDPFAGELGD